MMTPDRFRQVRNLFEAALEKQPGEREAFLANAGPDYLEDVQRLLEAHERRVSFLDGTLTAPPDLRTDPARMEGRRLGPFEILREIGHGGMGTVFLARRADGLFEQKVAVKVINPHIASSDFVHRFQQERAILATLDHPNIARLYDGGTTEEGWPYFVMEYLDGQPIDVWCDANRLSVSDRLRLFLNVCDAVQYAHRHRIIHRDIKPSNIFVNSDGSVKLLDFGIAKVVEPVAGDSRSAATRTDLLLMTPEYASPEQVRGEEMTPMSDVYSLGMVLYELLTGRRPYRLKTRIFHEVARIICEEPPRLPSTAATEPEERLRANGETVTLAPALLSGTREGSSVDLQRRLAGDLDNILVQTLAKRPKERYRSVESLQRDIDAHLNGHPIQARGQQNLRSAGRFIHRYRMQILLGAALVMAVATGALQLSRAGAVYFGIAAALIGIWTVAADRRLGAKAYEIFVEDLPLISFSAFVAIVIGLFVWESNSPGASIWYAQHLYLVAALLIVIRGFQWATRGRRTGHLVARGKRVRYGLVPLIIFMYVASMPFSVESRKGAVAGWNASRETRGLPSVQPIIETHGITSDFNLNIFMALGIAYQFLIRRYWEIRQNGIMIGGRFISWLRIESYRWSAPGRLVLTVRGPISLFPVATLKMDPARQAEVDAHLRRQLSDWPS